MEFFVLELAKFKVKGQSGYLYGEKTTKIVFVDVCFREEMHSQSIFNFSGTWVREVGNCFSNAKPCELLQMFFDTSISTVDCHQVHRSILI